jgi:hypothetical protein
MKQTGLITAGYIKDTAANINLSMRALCNGITAYESEISKKKSSEFLSIACGEACSDGMNMDPFYSSHRSFYGTKGKIPYFAPLRQVPSHKVPNLIQNEAPHIGELKVRAVPSTPEGRQNVVEFAAAIDGFVDRHHEDLMSSPGERIIRSNADNIKSQFQLVSLTEKVLVSDWTVDKLGNLISFEESIDYDDLRYEPGDILACFIEPVYSVNWETDPTGEYPIPIPKFWFNLVLDSYFSEIGTEPQEISNDGIWDYTKIPDQIRAKEYAMPSLFKYGVRRHSIASNTRKA